MLKILLITPPFTQLNTAYPATPYLQGFLKAQGYDVFQADLGIELINKIFSQEGFERLFEVVKKKEQQLSPNSLRIASSADAYVRTVDQVMNFLQYRDNTLAPLICSDLFLPRASRFNQLPDLEWSFGNIGVNDKARYFATLYVEDIGDLIKDAVTPYFGFSRYAEKLGLSAHSFAPIAQALKEPENLIEEWLAGLLKNHMDSFHPDVVGITIPFPGNLYAGLKCGQFIRKNFPGVKVVAGGGYVNTELRELSDPAVFDSLDYLTLDDGERPFLNVLKHLQGERKTEELCRTFIRIDGKVRYIDSGSSEDVSYSGNGCPDYAGLLLESYLSLIEIANPMHRLWSDGRWNKLTIAHGCYWHKCSFCDTSLDYIKRFEAVPAHVLVDRIERVIAQTGQTGFHFVDEAAPPAALKELALELLRRKTVISWWTNIRFEAAFTEDLCRLLAASGCIAATGGLETASDRLLTLMNKGVTVRQAAQVCRNCNNAGIMVHAYLMYGFPTQTAQETVDSLEIVRQFFEQGLIQSAFWHRFTATVHSDIGLHPGNYQCSIPEIPSAGFAKNDLVHEDPGGCDHQLFAQGLTKAVYNFMHGIGTELKVRQWFDVPVPPVSVKKNYVVQAIAEKPVPDIERMGARLLWLGNRPGYTQAEPERKEKGGGATALVIYDTTETITMTNLPETCVWLSELLPGIAPDRSEIRTLEEVKRDYETRFSASFQNFLRSHEWKTLRKKGLLLL